MWGLSYPGGNRWHGTTSSETWCGTVRRGGQNRRPGLTTQVWGVALGRESSMGPSVGNWAAGRSVVQVTKMESPGGEGAGRKGTCDGDQEREGSLSSNHAEFEVPLGPQVQLTSRAWR